MCALVRWGGGGGGEGGFVPTHGGARKDVSPDGTKMSLESRKARSSQIFFWCDDLRIATADLAVQIPLKSLDGIAFGESLGVSAF